MPNPITAGEWLVEAIGEAEKLEAFRHGFPVGPLATPVDTTAVRAYLAALKAIVEIHSVEESDGGPICTRCWMVGRTGMVPADYPCKTIAAVAEVFRGREGYDRWFR